MPTIVKFITVFHLAPKIAKTLLSRNFIFTTNYLKYVLCVKKSNHLLQRSLEVCTLFKGALQ